MFADNVVRNNRTGALFSTVKTVAENNLTIHPEQLYCCVEIVTVGMRRSLPECDYP